MSETLAVVWLLLGLIVMVTLRPFFQRVTVAHVLLWGGFLLSVASACVGTNWLVTGIEAEGLLREEFHGRFKPKALRGALLTGAGVIGVSVLTAAVWLRDGLDRRASRTAPTPEPPRDEHA